MPAAANGGPRGRAGSRGGTGCLASDASAWGSRRLDCDYARRNAAMAGGEPLGRGAGSDKARSGTEIVDGGNDGRDDVPSPQPRR
jgi:hypothetical protein